MSDETTNEHPEDETTGAPEDDQPTASASDYEDDYEDDGYDDDSYDDGDDEGPSDAPVATAETGLAEGHDGPTIQIRLLRNGDFPATITVPEGTTGRDLTNHLMNTRDSSGNFILRGANADKQTYLDDTGRAFGPSDVLQDGSMLNSVAKLGGA